MIPHLGSPVSIQPSVRTLFAAYALTTFAGHALAQDTSTETSLQRHQTASYAVDLPSEWRPLLAAEARELGEKLPFELRSVRPGELAVLGDVDRWLETGFDARAFVGVSLPGEIEPDEEGLTRIEEQIEQWRGPDGRRRRVEEARVGTVGQDGHPAILITTTTMDGDDTPLAEATEVYAPTGGRLLILGSWSWTIGGTRVSLDSPPDWIRSLTFARAPRGPDQHGDRILYAVGLGAVFATFLLVLRKRQRSGRPAGKSMHQGTSGG